MDLPTSQKLFWVYTLGILILTVATGAQIYVDKTLEDPTGHKITAPAFVMDPSPIKMRTPLDQFTNKRKIRELASIKPAKQKWSFDKLNLNNHSASKSSPIVDKSGIYIGTDIGHFKKIDHKGQLLWTFFVGDSKNGIHGTAAVDQDTVYFGAHNGRFYALNKHTGKMRWTIELGDAIGSSPLLKDNALFVTVKTFRKQRNGFLVKLNPNVGEVEWKTELFGDQSHSSVLAYEDTLIAASDNGYLFLVSQDGEILSEHQVQGEIRGTPLLINDLNSAPSLVVTHRRGKIQKIPILKDQDKLSLGKPQWTKEIKTTESSPVFNPIDQSIIFTDRDGIKAITLSTGEQIWQKKVVNDRIQFSTPRLIEHQKAIYVLGLCTQKSLCLINAENGEVQHKTNISGTLSNHISFYENSMIIAGDHELGLEAWTF